MTIYEKNFKRLHKLLPDLPQLENCLLKAEGFMDLIIIVSEVNVEYIVFTMGHFTFRENRLLADPIMELMLLKTEGKLEALSYRDSLHLFAEVYPMQLNGEAKVDYETKRLLNDFLGNWLENLLAQQHTKVEGQWVRQPQERSGQRYKFAGQTVITANVQHELSAGEIAFIIYDLHAFVKSKGGYVDGFQFYKNQETHRTIYCIDQLDEDMLNGESYTDAQKKEYNHYTLLFPEDY